MNEERVQLDMSWRITAIAASGRYASNLWDASLSNAGEVRCVGDVAGS